MGGNDAGVLMKTEFVIENLSIYEMQKHTCEHVNLNYRKSQCWFFTI